MEEVSPIEINTNATGLDHEANFYVTDRNIGATSNGWYAITPASN